MIAGSLRKLAWPALALALCASGPAGASSASAAMLCSTAERSVFFVEFAEGSATLTTEVQGRFFSHIFPQLAGGRYVDSLYVLASGDIAEGADWDKASAEARAADHGLAQKRIEAIRAMILSSGQEIGSAPIEVKARENKQVLSAEEMAANPDITAQVRAGIAATIRDRAPAAPAGQPMPVC